MKIQDIEVPGRAFLAPMAGVADRAHPAEQAGGEQDHQRGDRARPFAEAQREQDRAELDRRQGEIHADGTQMHKHGSGAQAQAGSEAGSGGQGADVRR